MRKLSLIGLGIFALGTACFSTGASAGWRECLKFDACLASGSCPTFETLARVGSTAEKGSFAGKKALMGVDRIQEFKTKNAFFSDKETGKRPYDKSTVKKEKVSTQFADMNVISYDRETRKLTENFATADIYDYAAVDHVKRHVEKELLDFPGEGEKATVAMRDKRYIVARETMLRSYVEAAALRGKLKNEVVPLVEQVQNTLRKYNNDYNQNVIASTTVSEAVNDVAALSARAYGLSAKTVAMTGIYAEQQLLRNKVGGKLGPKTTSFDF